MTKLGITINRLSACLTAGNESDLISRPDYGQDRWTTRILGSFNPGRCTRSTENPSSAEIIFTVLNVHVCVDNIVILGDFKRL